ncbi:Ephrin type-A receptor 3 [Takifugu flavidus]|uniref:Ephrin type-A receptor 3 n=1 Tax=Takifugu flavidus TaxID=433684 RepID=A0A5C6NYU1_9TELE|nr:Ephrin type-A receptor 3 [Takifugu flavidus]
MNPVDLSGGKAPLSVVMEGLAWGSPVCPPGPGSFVLVCLATAQSPDSPDEKSPKKSCFSGPLPQLRQGKHKRTITATVAGSEHGHPFLKELTGGEKEGRVPLGIITPSPSFAHFHTYTQTSLFQFSQLRVLANLVFTPLLPPACRPGTYKASATDAYCNKCPAHSSSPQEQAVECTCEKGFYRAEADPRAMACTRPPSAPENPISTVNETCVTLEWSPPRDTGGRGDITYSIHCRKCSGEGRKCAPCGSSVHYIPRQYGLSSTTVQVTDLQPDSNYSFTVESQNGVSDLSPTPRGTVAVNVTTSQTVSVVLKERRSKDSVTLAWQGPERPNGVIVEYEVIYYEKVSGTDARAHPHSFLKEKNQAGWRTGPPSCLYGKQAGASA